MPTARSTQFGNAPSHDTFHVGLHVADIANESDSRVFDVSDGHPKDERRVHRAARSVSVAPQREATDLVLALSRRRVLGSPFPVSRFQLVLYRRRVTFAARLAASVLALAAAACTTVDPGPNFVVPDEQFDADFFFCRVEPELLIAKKCGPGEGGDNNNCHFNSSAVSGMALAPHPTIECADGRPTNRAQIGAGSAAQGNLQAASLVMSRDYATAPIYLRPTGQNHPRSVFPKEDPVVDIIRQWAQK